jgi:hypothetical protein
MAKNIDSKDLEKALSKKESPEEKAMPKEMEIGFHQGALNTLINERNELIRMIQQTERVMQAHLKRLEEMGVKVRTDKKE